MDKYIAELLCGYALGKRADAIAYRQGLAEIAAQRHVAAEKGLETIAEMLMTLGVAVAAAAAKFGVRDCVVPPY